jgi:hypothetical protein
MSSIQSSLTTRGLRNAAVFVSCLGGASLLAGCYENQVLVPCNRAVAPVGLYSVTGDQQVTVYWVPVEPENVSEYVVYRSTSSDAGFREIGHSTHDYFVDGTVANGVTYFYAVSALDGCGYETELSRETVYDTPRPEGFGDRIYDANGDNWPRSGWDLSLARSVPWDDVDADMYFIRTDGGDFLVAADTQTDIQDAGYAGFDDVSWAPTSGWSPTGSAEVIPGHVYVVWTRDNHFAKVRARSLTADYLTFDWAYQIDTGNPELAPRPVRESASLSLTPVH